MIARRALLAAVLALSATRIARAQTAFSDQEMHTFASATLDLQALRSRDAAAMTHVIQASGMTVKQYNRMGDAMRADPELVKRLTPYLAAARKTRIGRGKTATTYDPTRPYDPGTGRASTRRRPRRRKKRTTSKTRR